MLENIHLITNFYNIVRHIHHKKICHKREEMLQKNTKNMKMEDNLREKRLWKMFVMSSHNSYLSNYQNFDFADISSVEFLIKLGVRCLEFDVYYKDKRLVIGHGTKNIFSGYDFITTNVIKLEDVFKNIRKLAFKNFSDLPLIINLELLVNDDMEAYQKIAEKIKKYFYGYILHSKFYYSAINLGNCKMKHLRKKIIFITQKKLNNNNPLAKYINAYTYSLQEIYKMEKVDPRFIFNLSYTEFISNKNIVKKHIIQKGLVRIYPQGSFITNFSSNYDFKEVMDCGIQFVSINIQQMGITASKYIDNFFCPFTEVDL